MGVFKVNGTDITTIGEVISTSDSRAKSNFFNSGKVSVTGLSDSSKTLAYAWTSQSNWGMYNIVGDKLKVNGTADRVAKIGTRPLLIYPYYADDIGYAENDSTSSNKSLTLTYNSSSNSITCSHVDSFTIGLTGGKLASGSVIPNTSVIVVCLCGGGGGGGGSGVGHGGGGGGGAATYIALLDFNNMPGGKVTITLGHPGAPGASTGSTGYSGSGGAASYISDGNGTILAYAHGGSAGIKGGDGGGGGAGNAVENRVGTTSYFRIYSSCSGANGGTGSRSGGSSNTGVAVSTPDGSYTPRSQTGGNLGGGKNGGGGGGAGGTSIWNAYGTGAYDLAYPSGADGGYDSSNASASGLFGGGGGGAGGTAIFNGRSGSRGGNGSCYIYYDNTRANSSSGGISGL